MTDTLPADGCSLQEMQETGRRFAELARNLDSVFWIFDPRTFQMDYISPAYETIWGRSCASLRGNPRSFLEGIHPEDLATVEAALARQLENQPTRIEYRVVRPDGAVRWVQDSGFPVHDPDGRIRRVAGMATDITQRKATEARAHLLSEVSRGLAGTLAVPAIYANLARLSVPTLADLCVVDLVEEGKIRRMTTAARPGLEQMGEWVNRTPPEPDEDRHPILRAMAERKLICEDITPETWQAMFLKPERLRMIEALQPRSYVVTPLVARGRVLGGLFFVRTVGGKGSFTAEEIALIEELTQRTAVFVDNAELYQEAERALERAETIAGALSEHVDRLRAVESELKTAVRLRDDFLSVASHELKTPLTTLRLQVDGLRRQIDSGRPITDERCRHSLGRVNTQLGRLERLVEELLDVSRIQAGHFPLRPERVNLGEVAAEVIAGFRQHPAYAERVRFQSDPVVVGTWDRARLDQILTNLLSNAVKYGRDRPVDVAIRAESSCGIIVVTDQGIGIPPAEQARVFELFERAAPAEHYGGIGLGLWIVRQVIEAMGGTIALESRVDVGSTFTVRLPGALAPEPGPSVSTAA